MYLALKPGENLDDTSPSAEACVADIGNWPKNNILKLNKSKTNLIVFSSKQHMMKAENLNIKIDSSHINAFISVRNLGLILDSILGMEKQVNHMCMFATTK